VDKMSGYFMNEITVSRLTGEAQRYWQKIKLPNLELLTSTFTLMNDSSVGNCDK